jgi:hypothetical protein
MNKKQNDTNITLTSQAIGKITVEAGREILQFTPQLYRKFGSTEPVKVSPWASSILLRVDDIHFLVTAGHVLLDGKEPLNPEDVGIMIGNVYHILNGNVKYTDTNLDIANSKVDLTIWKLEDPRVISDIQAKYKFLEPGMIEIDHTLSKKPNYLIVGFPITRTKLKPDTHTIKVDPFIFLTNEAKNSLYPKLVFENHSNIILNYRKRKIRNFNGTIGQGPDPYGISGCGLWYLPELKIGTDGNVPFKLVGIMTEWHNNDNAIIATRIHIVTEVIRREFGLQLPKSRITQINLS